MRKSACAGVGLLLAGGTMWSQSYVISTVAGGGAPFTPAAAAAVGLASPVGVAADGLGNVYFSSGNMVFKVDGSGSLTRVAGTGKAGYSGDSGPATEAQLNQPRGVAVDAGGALYIADSGNNVVRKVTADGVIAAVAGASASPAQFNAPAGVAVDLAGNLYISDTRNCRVRELTPGGAMLTVAGNGSCGFSGDGGAATSAQIDSPAGILVDAAGRLYIADSGNNAIRMVAPAGNIATVAGTGGLPGYDGDGGPAVRARLSAPASVAVDTAGNLYISDSGNSAIREVRIEDGSIVTLAGTGRPGFAGDGGPAANAQLWAPWGVATDSAGDVFIADSNNYRVRKIGTNGNISTLAGNGLSDYRGDGGLATSSQFVQPKAVAVDSSGNLYIADTFGNTVRKVTPDGTIATIAGTGVRGYSGDGGPATSAQLNRPRGVAVDSTGNVYISDTDNHRVRKVTTDGNIDTFAGTGVAGFSGDGAAPASAQLNSPCGLLADSSGNVFIADFGNNVVREVSSSVIGTIAGAFNAGYFGDGSAATKALLNSPTSVALDSAGNVYIADYYNHAIRKVTLATKLISTVAGNGTPGYSGDGSAATGAKLSLPWGVAVDSSGNVLIGDSGNNVIREVGSGGSISTVAGNNAGGAGYSGDGGAATSAWLNGASGLAVSSSGNVYVADTNNNVIRLLTVAASHAVLSVTATHSGFFQPGQTGAYSVAVGNATGAGATSGAVTVTATASAGLTVGSMSGTGWSCSGNTCTRSDALGAGSSYPAITVTGSVGAGPGSSVAIQIAVTGGGSPAAGTSDAAAVLGAPAAPVPVSPPNGAGLVPTAAALSWTSSGATSYEVFLGTSSTPSQVATTTVPGYTPPAGLSPGTTYYWQIVAVNPAGTASSAVWSFTTGFVTSSLQFIPVPPCRVADTRNPAGPFGGPAVAAGSMRSFAIPQAACNIPGTAQAYSLNVTAVPHGALPYLTLWPAGLAQPGVSTLNSNGGTVAANAAIVPGGAGGAVSVFAAGTTDVILDIDGYFAPAGGSSFYTATPCRVADTRGATGLFGGPSMFAGETRDFPIPSGPCAIPSGASAYSLNVTTVPNPARDFLAYLTTWATGQPRPVVSTLNSWTGTVVANMAIVPAGSNGSISVYVTDAADAILDTNGYFAEAGGAGALSFYPVAPCRVADTRGGTILGAGSTRSFAIPTSGCTVSPTAAAYSLNVTVVPEGPLSFLTAWPTGSARPFVSTLNALDGEVTANAAIVPAGTSGAISVYVTNATHVILDINGYFAP